MIFCVSDRDEQKFPINEEDLNNRLKKLEAGLPDQGDNLVPFVIPAFILFKDCGLITKDNFEFLSNAYLYN